MCLNHILALLQQFNRHSWHNKFIMRLHDLYTYVDIYPRSPYFPMHLSFSHGHFFPLCNSYWLPVFWLLLRISRELYLEQKSIHTWSSHHTYQRVQLQSCIDQYTKILWSAINALFDFSKNTKIALFCIYTLGTFNELFPWLKYLLDQNNIRFRILW